MYLYRMESSNLKMPTPDRVRTKSKVHTKMDIISEYDKIKQWDGNYIINTFFYQYLFNKYKQGCSVALNDGLGIFMNVESNNINFVPKLFDCIGLKS